jgi:hypothetical protein
VNELTTAPETGERPAPRSGGAGPAHRLLLYCGLAAGPLFIAATLVQGALRPGYDPVRHPISSLAIGDPGWVQALNFIATGTLTALFAAGVRRSLHPGRGALWGPVLLACWGAGLIGAGVFESDPVSGFPAGTPALPDEATPRGILHDACSLAGFACLLAACLVLAARFGRTRRGWAAYSLATAVAFGIAMQLASLAFGQVPGLVEAGGLLQRAALLAGFGWMSALAVHLMRAPTRATVQT